MDTNNNKDKKEVTANLRSPKKASLNAQEAVKIGWEAFKEHPWLSIGVLIFSQVLSVGFNFILTNVNGVYESFAMGPVAMVTNQLISVYVAMVMIYAFLRMYDNKDVNLGNILLSWRKFVNYFLVTILVGVAVLIGFMLLIIPGVILSFKLSLAPYLVIDRDMGPINAIKESWRLTKGNIGYLLSLAILLLGVNLLGLLALVVGLVVSISVSFYAGIHAYRTILKTNE